MKKENGTRWKYLSKENNDEGQKYCDIVIYNNKYMLGIWAHSP